MLCVGFLENEDMKKNNILFKKYNNDYNIELPVIYTGNDKHKKDHIFKYNGNDVCVNQVIIPKVLEIWHFLLFYQHLDGKKKHVGTSLRMIKCFFVFVLLIIFEQINKLYLHFVHLHNILPHSVMDKSSLPVYRSLSPIKYCVRSIFFIRKTEWQNKCLEFIYVYLKTT